MKILVTGLTGFIGRALGAQLTRDGHEVVGLVRDPKGAKLAFPARLLEWNAEAPNLEIFHKIDDLDAIVHLAGEPLAGGRWTTKTKAHILDSRVKGTSFLVALAKRIPHPITFVSASAIGYYGDAGEDNLDENHRPGTDYAAEVCVAWERSLLAAQVPNLRKVVLRFALVMGNGGGLLARIVPIFQKSLGGVLGSGKQWMSWVHIDDVVRVLEQAVTDKSMSGVYNVSAPEPVSNREFTEHLAKVLGKSAVLPVPKAALKLAFGELADALLASQKVEPKRLKEMDFKFRYPQLLGALQSLL